MYKFISCIWQWIIFSAYLFNVNEILFMSREIYSDIGFIQNKEIESEILW